MNVTFDIVGDPSSWTDLMHPFPQADFHHSPEFHAISQQNGEGEPVLLTARADGRPLMAWPMLARDIPGSDARDLGSVYGYPGPLFAADVDQYGVLQHALEYLKSTGFVSVSARLHPIANAPLLSQERTDIRQIGQIVAADLSRDVVELKREIRGAKNGTIKKIEKSGVSLRQSRDPADTPIFQSIYRETMDRIGAAPYYYFPDSYMDALLASESFDASYVFAELDGQAIAASSIIETSHYRQYYLSGTATDHTRLSPMSLILRDQIFEAKQSGRKWFVLGGGLGGKEDSLTQFKLGFSKTTLPAGLICKILDPAVYTELAGSAATDGYFPAYRQP